MRIPINNKKCVNCPIGSHWCCLIFYAQGCVDLHLFLNFKIKLSLVFLQKLSTGLATLGQLFLKPGKDGWFLIWAIRTTVTRKIQHNCFYHFNAYICNSFSGARSIFYFCCLHSCTILHPYHRYCWTYGDITTFSAKFAVASMTSCIARLLESPWDHPLDKFLQIILSAVTN